MITTSYAAASKFPGKTKWLRIYAKDAEAVENIEKCFQIHIKESNTRAVTEENGFLIIPIEQIIFQNEQYREVKIFVIFNNSILITVEIGRIYLLDTLEGESDFLKNADARRILFQLLFILNGSNRNIVRRISNQLSAFNRTVCCISNDFNVLNRSGSVADIAGAAVSLQEAEELVAKAVDGLLQLARAARWLLRDEGDDEARARILDLIQDTVGLVKFSRYQHASIQNMEESMMTTLDVKQNQITKVFTVITAVFTPPTLVGAFYGQNFAYMPELMLPSGEWFAIAMTAIAALIPIFYILRKGWMR